MTATAHDRPAGVRDDRTEPAHRRGRSTVQQHREAVARVIRAMRDRLDEPWTLARLAQVAYLSPFHFSRVFRLVTGTPPGRFLSALRMAEARRLVISSRMNVTDICTTVGYSSLGTFTTQFTEQIGVGPGRLRRLDAEHGERPLEHVVPAGTAPADRTGARGGTVTGTVHTPDEDVRLVLLGLFPSALAQGLPVACTSVTGGGPFAVTGVPEGTWHLLACAHPEAATVGEVLAGAPDRDVWVGTADVPVVVRPRRSTGPLVVRLAPARPTDPPILSGLPVLSRAAPS
ncbi:AraC family transcriptional regulator [Salinispora sp. H7-4]|uniref:helix-turn-helix domain-containing protein n=1 Tax=Salinispora sp. H7-4 TaxID=2748321 RepID=UPI0015D1F490|nr:AraC family transcriptional regulator [Salinispora sp. H7-4]NYT95301.1 helix-turn-helix transcriptional regulator [Salinispora sp. H7-4]